MSRAGICPAILPALVLIPGGCTTPSPVDEPLEARRFAVLETLPPARSLRGEDLCPFREGRLLLEIVEGDEDGRRIVHAGAPSDRFGAAFALAMSEDRTEFWALDEDGSVIMPAVIDHPQRALTRFTPPLLIAPHRLTPGEKQSAEVAMRVLDVRNPRRQRESGTAQRTIEYVGDERIATPQGEFIAQRVEIRFIADLTFAKADNRTTCWVVPGMGVVARRDEEEIRILGLVSERKARTLVRMDEGLPEGGDRRGGNAPDPTDRTD